MSMVGSTRRITRLAAQIRALHAELLREIATVDQAEGWRRDGAASIADWLVARLDVSHATARAWVDVAARFGELPDVAAGLAAGRLSFDQVRVMCRFATPEEEAYLAARAEPVARLQREARRRERIGELAVRSAREARSLDWWRDAPARLVRFRGALPDHDWAVVERAISRIATSVPGEPDGGLASSAQRRRADALVQLASQSLGSDADPDRATVVVHVRSPQCTGELESGTMIGEPALRRIACDARIEEVRENDDGVAVGVGRATRRVPGWLTRQIAYRDRGCRFPGCERVHWVHAHHLVHWIDGGPTDLDNLITLCGFHHRLVHEDGWRILGDPNGEVSWIRPDGSAYDPRRSRLLEGALIATAMRAEFCDAVYQRRTLAAQV